MDQPGCVPLELRCICSGQPSGRFDLCIVSRCSNSAPGDITGSLIILCYSEHIYGANTGFIKRPLRQRTNIATIFRSGDVPALNFALTSKKKAIFLNFIRGSGDLSFYHFFNASRFLGFHMFSSPTLTLSWRHHRCW